MIEFLIYGLFVITILVIPYFVSYLEKVIKENSEKISKQINDVSEQFDRIQLQLDYLTSTKETQFRNNE